MDKARFLIKHLKCILGDFVTITPKLG